MSPEQNLKLINDTQHFFQTFGKQVTKEIKVFETAARGKVRYLSEWLTRLHDANIKHVMEKTPWDDLQVKYGANQSE